ncbi:MAG: VOC family protein [Solirubrobacteraceae bacterium]
MTQTASEAAPAWQAPDVVPTLRYQDAPAAIDWLERAFGFERHAVYADPDDSAIIHHAELRFGSGMIMPGSARESRGSSPRPVLTPSQAGGSTGATYVIVDDPDAHHERAKAAGAEILREPIDQDYGSRDYSACDLEGHIWSFGTYRPARAG